MAYIGLTSNTTSNLSLDLDNFTGDGSTTTFVRTNGDSPENATLVFIDGVYQEKTEYSISGTSVIFTVAPANTSGVEVLSNKSGSNSVDTFTGDGSTVSFVRASSTSTENQTLVYTDGVYQSKDQYSVSGSTIIMSTAPANGVTVEIMSY